MIGEEFRQQLIDEELNPDEVLAFTSKYNKKTDTIITLVTMKNGTNRSIESKPVWYASRKNKKW
tara:strand:- start:550 stop:741 length:192 start_codon:yes stop_codon:yes gene_type:complete